MNLIDRLENAIKEQEVLVEVGRDGSLLVLLRDSLRAIQNLQAELEQEAKCPKS